MAAPKLLGLPPISSELKSISPFLQRADELTSKEPIMAYWCAYYAAQVGISLKAKDTPSRNLLFDLLGVLEHMKKEIGTHDAIDIESASSAYVENFALRVFATADNEDRRGDASRSTAKKFLAAANFLQVLKIFPKSEISEANEEKIRYAKWKAADIAKAFREGRKPTPGPAGSGLEPQQPTQSSPTPSIPIPPHLTSTPTTSSTNTINTNSSSSTLTTTTGRTSPPKSSPSSSPTPKPTTPPHLKRISPPPHMDHSDITRANQDFAKHSPPPHTPPRGAHLGVDVEGAERGWGGQGQATPGSWSTAATPGTARGTPGVFDDSVGEDPSGYEVGRNQGTRSPYDWDQESPSKKGKGKEKRRGSGSSNGSGGGSPPRGGGVLKRAWVSGELENSMGMGESFMDGPGGNQVGNGKTDATAFGLVNNGHSKKSVHFTPSVTGGLSSTGGTPPISPGVVSPVGGPSYGSEPPTGVAEDIPARARAASLTSPPDPSQNPTIPPHPLISPQRYSTDLPAGFPHGQVGWGPGGDVPSPGLPYQPPPPPPQLPSDPQARGSPTIPYTYASPPPLPPTLFAPPPAPLSPPRLSPPAPLTLEVELTPAVIAKAQKHCRFAISALDYEDAEQAKRELRAALAVLGE